MAIVVVSVRMVMVVVMLIVSAATMIVFILPICGFCPRALKYTKKVSFSQRLRGVARFALRNNEVGKGAGNSASVSSMFSDAAPQSYGQY